MGIPEGVKEVIGCRLSRLSDVANRVLAAAAVEGRSFGLSLCSNAWSRCAEENVLEAVEEATAAQLVREEPDRPGSYSFAHPLIHETLDDERVSPAGCACTPRWPTRSTPMTRICSSRSRATASRPRAAAPPRPRGRGGAGRRAARPRAVGRRGGRRHLPSGLEVAERASSAASCLLVRGDSLSRSGEREAARACYRDAAELARAGSGTRARRSRRACPGRAGLLGAGRDHPRGRSRGGGTAGGGPGGGGAQPCTPAVPSCSRD